MHVKTLSLGQLVGIKSPRIAPLVGVNIDRCITYSLIVGVVKVTRLLINPLNPIVRFWLHHTAHCAEKIVSARLRTGSASAERVGQGEVGGVIGRVVCTWWLPGLALKRPLLVPVGPPHALTAWTGGWCAHGGC